MENDQELDVAAGNDRGLAMKRFSAKMMLNNIDHIKDIIQRIRQKEGGIGSEEDELSLYRMVQDLDLLIDMVDGVKAAYDELLGKFDTVAHAALTLQNQNESLKATYEKMVQDRSDRIKELETELGIRPEKTEPEPEPEIELAIEAEPKPTPDSTLDKMHHTE